MKMKRVVIIWALVAFILSFTKEAEAFVKKTWCGEFYYTAVIKNELHCGGGCMAANCATSILWVLAFGTTDPDIVQQCDTPGCPCKNYYIPDYLWETYTNEGNSEEDGEKPLTAYTATCSL